MCHTPRTENSLELIQVLSVPGDGKCHLGIDLGFAVDALICYGFVVQLVVHTTNPQLIVSMEFRLI